MEARRMIDEGDFSAERLETDVLKLEDERERRAAANRPKWRRLPDVVDEIWSRKDEPWIELRLVDESLARIRPGGIVVLMGGPGGGKSSLAMNLLMQHAADVGPAIACSIELPGDELGARGAGIKCDASWEDVLTGRLAYEHLQRALALPRFFFLERKDANLQNLAGCIDAARKEFPQQPILVAIDYVQIAESEEREIRMRLIDVFQRIDAVGREQRVVTLALSQMGRAGDAAATSGEKLGAETAALGAESAAIERYATTTLTIGKKGEPREDGSQEVDLNIGKGRMTGGDVVIPMAYWGRTGLYRVAGDRRRAAQVREERDQQRTEQAERALDNQLIGAASRANEPLSRDQLMELVSGRRAIKRQAITRLLSTGDLVEVSRRASRSRAWSIWTRDRAAAAGVRLASEMEGGA